MPVYELSIDPQHVRRAEFLSSLEKPKFPTLAVGWEIPILGQTWRATLVQDYAIALPPLRSGVTFNEVRIAAYTGEVATKYLYFGTELHESAPRVAPEMENSLTDSGLYQEYRLTADTSPVPYLQLINSTPRIYGNGPQDYYSPSIAVERFDAELDVRIVADKFRNIVAGLPHTPGEQLLDPAVGFWRGSRYVGTRRVAVLRNGVVAGLLRREGRGERDAVPPDVVRRDPSSDRRDEWVAIDLGRMTTVVAVGDARKHRLIALDPGESLSSMRDYEIPSEVAFLAVGPVLRAWTDRVILPLTEWGEVLVGAAARRYRQPSGQGEESLNRMRCSLLGVPMLDDRRRAGRPTFLCSRDQPDNVVPLEAPAEPVIDEDGIDPDDPFDPLELFGYYLGIHLNRPENGVFTKYTIGMPTGLTSQQRRSAVVRMRRGLYRSLPAGMLPFDDLEAFAVVDGGPSVLAFATAAFRVFGVTPVGHQQVPFAAVELGASEAALVCGFCRAATTAEAASGRKRVIDNVEPRVFEDLGTEQLLERLAFAVYVASGVTVRSARVPFEPPTGPPPGDVDASIFGDLLNSCLEAQTNARVLGEALRVVMEDSTPQPLPESLVLYDADGKPREVPILADREKLVSMVEAHFDRVIERVGAAIVEDATRVTRDNNPLTGLRVLLGGRASMRDGLQRRFSERLPGTTVHVFREPEQHNLSTPTVKVANAIGYLALQASGIAPTLVEDDRSAFVYQLGRNKRGRFMSVLAGGATLDEWHEYGACTRPQVKFAIAPASANVVDGALEGATELACDLGYDAVGYRIYVRAISSARVEVALGPPGNRPDDDAPRWHLDLSLATVTLASSG